MHMYIKQGCRVGTGAAAAAPVPAVGTKLSQRAGTIYSEPKSESDITSGTAATPRKVVSNSY